MTESAPIRIRDKAMEEVAGLRLPATNVVRVNFKNLEQTLAFYQTDGVGFLGQLPRLRQ